MPDRQSLSPRVYPRALWACLTVIGLSALAAIDYEASAQSSGPPERVLTGLEAFGDWSRDAPGTRRLITVEDLPRPGDTMSASNGARIVERPATAWPLVPAGFTVGEFFKGMKEPRQMKAAPNGDIFIAESGANRIRVLRAAPRAARAGEVSVFVAGLSDKPFGIAFYPTGPEPQFVYVATETQVLRYPYRNGDLVARGSAEVIVDKLPRGGHWTRDLLFTPDASSLLVSIGSGSNDAEYGMEHETGRADILSFAPDGSQRSVYASGLRNPVSMAIDPANGTLWTSVNERDTLGDNLPPDYVTRVTPGGFYGWPWYYIGAHPDPKNGATHPELSARTLVPDVLIQPHSAPLGIAFYGAASFPTDYHGDLFVALHGSWNRAKRTGYKIVRVHLTHGAPNGEYQDFMTGFVTPEGNVWGRPVGLTVAADGALLVSDDASGTIWRIVYGG